MYSDSIHCAALLPSPQKRAKTIIAEASSVIKKHNAITATDKHEDTEAMETDSHNGFLPFEISAVLTFFRSSLIIVKIINAVNITPKQSNILWKVE